MWAPAAPAVAHSILPARCGMAVAGPPCLRLPSRDWCAAREQTESTCATI